MKSIVVKKFMIVLSLSMLSVFFTANSAQAAAYCCCCSPFPHCEPASQQTCPTCGEYMVDCAANCTVEFCTTSAEEDSNTLQSFLDEEYVDEIDETITPGGEYTLEQVTEEPKDSVTSKAALAPIALLTLIPLAVIWRRRRL